MKLVTLFRLLCLCLLLSPLQVGAVTYANTSFAYNWIDSSTHTKLGYNTSPYKFNGLSGCGTTPPIIDDTISDEIPIGFSFLYAGVSFTTLRVMTNGRVQFNGNTTCGYGSPVQQLPYPDSTLNYTMRIYGNDLDPTSKIDVPSYNTNCLSKSVCYISYATIGVAPYRSFIVTWNNVPEWTTGANPTGSYSLQLILQENGEFIYQYGADVAGPSAALGQVGWQADTSDYDTPQTGFPVNNTAIKFYIPQPVLEYRMEQASWATTAVIDTSGNGRNGTALGAAQTIANGKVCRAGNFPSNTSVGTIDAINSGVSIPTTVGGAGTITFWYRGNTAWTGGVDAQLLDASVVNGQWFFLVRRSNGDLRFVMTDAGGTIRAVETPAITVAANTWKHIAISWSFNALVAANSDHLRIYVDGVLQTQSSFSTTSSLSTSIGTLYIGDNRSAFTGSNGTGNSANGAIDELRVYNYEGGVALVQRDFNQGGAVCLNHSAVPHTGPGVTCQQNIVTVYAHDSSHALITMPNNTTTIQLSTSSGRGDWALINGYGVLNNGTADDGIATYLFNGEYQAVFGLTHSTAASVTIHVSDGQFTELSTEDPLLVISACLTNGFNACELTSPRCVPSISSTTYALLNTKLANNAYMFDVVKLKTNGSLDNTFNGAASVDLLANSSSVALSSNNCPVSQTAIIPLGAVTFSSGYGPASGVSVAANAFTSVGGYSAYRDVRVRFTCSAANCGTPIVACSTDNYAVRPTDFTVTSSANADSTGSNTTASPVVKAGANFTLTATAVPGYSATPKLDSSKVAAHAGALRIVAPTGFFSSAAPATGSATGTFTYTEVGYFNFTADGVYDDSFSAVDSANGGCTADFSNVAVSGKYGCNFGNVAASSYFGRFVPDHFAITLPVLTAACPSATSFSYFSQDGYTTAFTLTAQELGNGTTQNYNGSFAKLDLGTYKNYGFTAVTLPTGSALSSSATPPSGAWSRGVATVTAKHQISRPTTPTAETALTTLAAPSDGEVTTATPIALGSALNFRYGRLWLGNAYGSDKKSLVLPYQTQYWNGQAFITNTLDSCTSLSSNNVALVNKQGGLGSYNGPASVSATNKGVGAITLPAVTGLSGSVDVLLALGSSGTPSNCYSWTGGTVASLAYLSGKWCGANYDRDPVARATFGINATSRQIDMREGF